MPPAPPMERRRRNAGNGVSTVAIIVAAGRGLRAGDGVPKQWRALAGRRAGRIRWPPSGASRRSTRSLLVLHPEDAALAAPLLRRRRRAGRAAARRAMPRSAPGWRRWRASAATRVLIHDGARPFAAAARDRAGCSPRSTTAPAPPRRCRSPTRSGAARPAAVTGLAARRALPGADAAGLPLRRDPRRASRPSRRRRRRRGGGAGGRP